MITIAKKIFHYSTLVLMFSLCVYSTKSTATQDLERRAIAFIIKIAPFGMYSTNGNVIGHYADIANLIGKQLRFETELILVPYSRAQKLISRYPMSFTVMTRSHEIMKNSIDIGKIMDLRVLIVSLSDFKINNLQQLKNKRILKVRGTHLYRQLEAAKIGQLIETPDTLNQIHMLLSKKGDAAIVVEQDLQYVFDELANSGQEIPRLNGYFVHALPVHIWVDAKSKGHPFVTALEKAVLKMKGSEEYSSFLESTAVHFPKAILNIY